MKQDLTLHLLSYRRHESSGKITQQVWNLHINLAAMPINRLEYIGQVCCGFVHCKCFNNSCTIKDKQHGFGSYNDDDVTEQTFE